MNHIVWYHGNCTDGFAAFSIYRTWAVAKGDTVAGYPVAPHDTRTWPIMPTTEFTVAFLDVVPDEATLLRWEAAAQQTTVIDHHATSADTLLSDFASGHFPQKKGTIIQFSTESCAAVLTHKWYLPTVPVPDWLGHVDRVDRWTDVTGDDLALREYLHAIAKLPVSEPEGTAKALTRLDSFVARYSTEDIRAESEKLLAAKTKRLDALLANRYRTSRVLVGPSYCTTRSLDPTWCGQTVFSIDTTGVFGFDSTLASHLVFSNCPEVTVFVNYNQIGPQKYKYCVRSRGFDVTYGGDFFGHPCAAGGVLEGPKVPFLV